MANDRYRDQGGWRGPGRGESMFGNEGGAGRQGGGGNDDRGFFERAGEQVRSWLGDEGGRGGSHGGGRSEWDRQEPWGGGGDYAGNSFGGGSRGPRTGGHPLDDHYRSWRDRQIEQLDRDYEEYCRDRQQQFETDFHSWRQSRQGRGSGGGMADAQATSTSTGGSGLGADASFGSSNPDGEASETGSEEAPRTRTNQP